MKIEIVIKAFEDIVPFYEKAIKEKWDDDKIWKNNLESGICLALRTYLKYDVYSFNIFTKKGYYKNYTNDDGYLFEPILRNKESLHQRLKFLKTEIKDLKRLQKLGYTDI